MLFSSTVFLYLFLPFVLFCYYALLKKSRKLQNLFLFIVSLFFYGWGEPKFVFVMMASIVVNWIFGIIVSKCRKGGRDVAAKIALGVDVSFNLLLLFVFKYLSFASSVAASAGFGVPVFNIVLPIGISFFTFQAMSYVIDVYRDRGEVQTNILNVGLYISFFPQLIAGPIVRYETVADEIKNRRESFDDFCAGFARFVTGLGKKVLLANSFAVVADKCFDMCGAQGSIAVALAWLGAVMYTLQIFFDFSGYSDMAIGLGKMFGFHFLENFDYPYISKSITEFWRRWHISLGTWFRDYVYFPLGGSRVSTKSRLIFNLFAVWLLTGIWHGAEWSFVVWGLMYFALLCVEKLTGMSCNMGKFASVIGRVYTLFFVIIGWVIFRADNLHHAGVYLASMFGRGGVIADGVFSAFFAQNLPLLAVGVLCSTPLFRNIGARCAQYRIYGAFRAVCLIGLFVLCLANLVSNSYNPFIYFNF